MRIGIDARFFGPEGKGLGRYTQRLIENLERVADDHEFVVFLRRENYDLYRPASPRFRKVLADFRWYSLSEQVRYPGLIRREGVDLMHFPHFNVPLATPCPFVVTIHDLILFRYPTLRATTLHPIWYGIKYAAYRAVIARAAKRAERIITVSECTKRDIVASLGTPPERIDVTYEAADPLPDTAKPIDLRAKDIRGPYLLYVGNAYPHKNLETLLEVFKRMRDGGLEAQLVLVGKMDHFYGRLRNAAERLGLLTGGDVVFYGFADDDELSELYRQARLYVFPSLLEGFGLPPLEAMRYGIPVAASDSSCLPEILADAAVYFAPDDRESMCSVLLRAFDDETLRAKLAAAGPERARGFTWKDCALRTYRIYLSASKP